MLSNNDELGSLSLGCYNMWHDKWFVQFNKDFVEFKRMIVALKVKNFDIYFLAREMCPFNEYHAELDG